MAKSNEPKLFASCGKAIDWSHVLLLSGTDNNCNDHTTKHQ